MMPPPASSCYAVPDHRDVRVPTALKRCAHAIVSNPNPVGRDRSQMGNPLYNFGVGADRSTGRQFDRDTCERALMVLEVATEN
jgi:hypothetical protein